jgi:hypothetical protein
MTETEIKEHPILFSTPMVQAILEGRKTVTRRVINESFNGCLTNGGPHPCPNEPIVIYPGETYDSPCHPGESITVDWPQVRAIFHCSTLDSEAKCRQGKPGDILWVRETWAKYVAADCVGGVTTRYRFKADNIDECYQWKPSIHMPKIASRIKLLVKSITVESLHQITEEDAIKEGIYKPVGSQFFQATNGNGPWGETPVQAFENLWKSINGEESFQANPWVWRIEFKKI